jgi:hypothetical protein
MAKTYISSALMRFSLLAMALLIFISPSSALVAPLAKPATPGAENALSKMSVEEFLSLTPKKFRQLTGEKLSIPQKISLKIAQKRVKQAIKNKEAVDETIMATAIDTSDFNIGGFILGLLLSVVGVLIAYLIGDSTVIKWAWIGFGIFLIIFLLAVLL